MTLLIHHHSSRVGILRSPPIREVWHHHPTTSHLDNSTPHLLPGHKHLCIHHHSRGLLCSPNHLDRYSIHWLALIKESGFIFGFDDNLNLCIHDGVCVYGCVCVCVCVADLYEYKVLSTSMSTSTKCRVRVPDFQILWVRVRVRVQSHEYEYEYEYNSMSTSMSTSTSEY